MDNFEEKIKFCLASSDDISELVRMRLYYIGEDFGEQPEDEIERIKSMLPSYFERNLGKNLFVFAAKDGKKIVGTAFLNIIEKPASPTYKKGKSSEVLNVVTMKEYRGMGIASRLIENLLKFARENEIDKVNLSATKMGYPIYKKLGFSEVDNHYVEMVCKLS